MIVAVQCSLPPDALTSGDDSPCKGASAAKPTAPILFSEPFEDACFEQRGWYDNMEPAVSTTEHAPGGKGAAEFRFPMGASTPLRGGAMRHKFTATSSVYVSYRVKYSEGWVGSGKPYHPHEFYLLSTMDEDFTGPSHNWMTLYVEQNYDNGGRPRLIMQDSKAINVRMGSLPLSLVGLTDDRSSGGCNGVLEDDVVTECYDAPPWTNNKQLRGPVVFQPTPGPGYISNWNLVEAYFQLNTIEGGVARRDGVMQYWFNGTLIIDRHDIVFRTAARADLRMNKIMIAPYMGDGSPIEQTMYVDDLVVATRRPGS
jgi:hypothetical protein